jgi:malonyl-CoA decarboxylase
MSFVSKDWSFVSQHWLPRLGHTMNTAFFSDLLSSIADRGRSLLGRRDFAVDPNRRASGVVDLCEALLSGRGEASGVALAREVLVAYEGLDPAGRLSFFEALAERFGPDRAKLDRAIEAWRATPGGRSGTELHFAAEPRRQELFRRLNRAPGGTASLVHMRQDLLDFKSGREDLATVDRDFAHLLASWFNRGFLVLRRIDWATPASVLEKIIRYEAVHAIRDWDDLRRRIDPADRRCYAFFHPALVDDPLIFVEVALTEAIPSAIAPLLAETRQPAAPEKARTAVFYSISNCQRGLDGISFGNFLIKQVVEELRRELPRLEHFVTLSPVPGFMKWLAEEEAHLGADEREVASRLADPAWAQDPGQAEEQRKAVEALAADYFLNAKAANGRPRDPVARFHLGNGARLERINFLGDSSPRALRDGGGLMVNYLYDLDEIEANHEAYANQKAVAASGAVRRMLRRNGRMPLQVATGSSN